MKSDQHHILIRPHRGIPYLRRCLWSIAVRQPVYREGIVYLADTDQVALDELKKFSAMLHWKFLRCENGFSYVEAIKHVESDRLFVVDPTTIVWGDAFKTLLHAFREGDGAALASIRAVPRYITEKIDDYGANLHIGMVNYCDQFPIANSLLFHDRCDFLAYGTRNTVAAFDSFGRWTAGPVTRTDLAIGVCQEEEPVKMFADSLEARVVEVVTNMEGKP